MTYKVPSIGALITVVTQYSDPYHGNPTGIKQNRYERVPVVENDKWTQPGEFCIPADNEPYIDKRTINVSHVVELIVHGSAAELEASTGTTFVKVPGSKGQTYTVTVVNGTPKACECAGFVYRKHCRHLQEAIGETTMTKPKTVRPTLEPLMQLPPAPTLAATTPAKPRKPRAAKAPKRTKAFVVRDLIRLHKEAHGPQATPKDGDLINQVVAVVGFSRQLARAYLKANWSKVQ